MAYLYRCPLCQESVEVPAPRVLTCPRCAVGLVLVAEERWVFRCQGCGRTFRGHLGLRNISECGVCGGVVTPAHPEG